MKNCIICGNDTFIPVYKNTLKKCTSCGFLTANMDVGEELLKSIYSIDYFQGEEYLDYVKDKKVLQLNFEKRIPSIRKALKKGPPIANCLEIGCAYGFFGEILLRNFSTKYKGIDVVAEAVNYGKNQLKLDLVTGNFLDQPAPSSPWTDVFMWDVIEHLRDPQLFLQKAWTEMMPGGRIYITTGDAGAILARLQGRKWRMIHPPSHIHYFSRKTLGLLFKKSGFRVLRTAYLPVFRSIRQIYHSLFLLKKPEKVSSKLFNLIPAQWHVPLNTFDIIFITAIKEKY